MHPAKTWPPAQTPKSLARLTPLAEARRIMEQFCQAHQVSVAEMIGPSHEQRFVRIRSDLMLVLRDKGFALKTIGMLLHRDHSTVIAALKKRTGRSNSSMEEYGDAQPVLPGTVVSPHIHVGMGRQIEELKKRLSALESRLVATPK